MEQRWQTIESVTLLLLAAQPSTTWHRRRYDGRLRFRRLVSSRTLPHRRPRLRLHEYLLLGVVHGHCLPQDAWARLWDLGTARSVSHQVAADRSAWGVARHRLRVHCKSPLLALLPLLQSRQILSRLLKDWTKIRETTTSVHCCVYRSARLSKRFRRARSGTRLQIRRITAGC